MCVTQRPLPPNTSVPKCGWRLGRWHPGYRPVPGQFKPTRRNRFRRLLPILSAQSSQLMRRGRFGRKPQSFIRKRTASERFQPDIRATTTTSTSWRKARSRHLRFPILFLLKDVVEFKERFYYSSWARYDLAQPGSFRLSPPENQTPALARDYRAMREMFYREPPEFTAILEGLATLEREINDPA